MANDQDPCKVREHLTKSLEILRRLDGPLASEVEHAVQKYRVVDQTFATSIGNKPVPLLQPDGLLDLMQRLEARLHREPEYHPLANKIKEAANCLRINYRTDLRVT